MSSIAKHQRTYAMEMDGWLVGWNSSVGALLCITSYCESYQKVSTSKAKSTTNWWDAFGIENKRNMEKFQRDSVMFFTLYLLNEEWIRIGWVILIRCDESNSKFKKNLKIQRNLHLARLADGGVSMIK